MKARFFLSVGFVALAACQTYDFQPVPSFTATQHDAALDMKATTLPPNIMVLIDKSDSMNELVSPGKNVDGSANPACTKEACTDTGYCPNTCSTRINELRDAMKVFLPESLEISKEDPRPLGKFGLTLFPSDDYCAPPSNVEIGLVASDEDADLKAQIGKVQKYIDEKLYNSNDNGKPINGGTPTGDSLRYLLQNVPALKDKDRKSFILLLTDGLPNCNPSVRQSDCGAENVCRCTLYGKEGLCTAQNNCEDSLGCLDNFGTVNVIRELHNEGIGTIVIGFGVEQGAPSIDAKAVLDAMALAGGVNPTHFPAKDKASLLAVLRNLREVFEELPCTFKLSGQVSDPSLISVHVDEQRINPGDNTYSYNKELNAVVFAEAGELCARLKKSSNKNPVALRITVLQTF